MDAGQEDEVSPEMADHIGDIGDMIGMPNLRRSTFDDLKRNFKKNDGKAESFDERSLHSEPLEVRFDG